ncbi:unnamed protein product [Phytophthora fragariaefolia]|uniref:Unnamed protein product n=1 Tax=Phytophthora fragariaefolia TaxID=1490495 RepID=A0A9W7D1Y6_9STRA|nr:unnamed protein product [Phytophthora fragariaefolia]
MQIDDIDLDRDDDDLKDKRQTSVPLMTQTRNKGSVRPGEPLNIPSTSQVVFAFTLPGTGYTLARPTLHQDIEYPKIEVNPDAKIAWPGVCQPHFNPRFNPPLEEAASKERNTYPQGNPRLRSTSACEFRSKEPKIDNSTIHRRSDRPTGYQFSETTALELVLAQKKVVESGLPPRKWFELDQLTQKIALKLVFAPMTVVKKMWYGISQDPPDPFYGLLKGFSDVINDDPPSVLPPDRGVRHEIDLMPGTKYCITRQWPYPKKQVDVIDAFFATMHAAGMVRKSKSPHSSPTFCVRKPNGK